MAIRVKKDKAIQEQDPEKVAACTQEIALIPESQIVYVDETGIDTYLYREYCWSPKGQKVTGLINGRKYHRAGVVAAQMGKQILAPLQYDGTMDSQLFEI